MKTKKTLKKMVSLGLSVVLSAVLFTPNLLEAKEQVAQESKPVTLNTILRAETDTAIKVVYAAAGLGKFFHHRAPIAIDKQEVIRMNRDTIYSGAIIDLSKPASVILPETNGRYMSLHVINQDHYSYATSKPGIHKLTKEKVGSRYAYLIIRTFIDADNAKDIKAANALQDAISIKGGANEALDLPNWNMEQLLAARAALITLADLGSENFHANGTKEEVDPIDHLVYGAASWGGLPQKSATYELRAVKNNDGTPHSVTAKDVPVDAFWSVTVYGADGFIHENPQGAYSFNNITAKANKDDSVTINFGACDDGRVNCLPISKGWSYTVRMYEPHEEILDGSWKFPEIVPSK